MSKCPSCGYCPHCGRKDAAPKPSWPYTQPWINPYPNSIPWTSPFPITWTSSGSGNYC